MAVLREILANKGSQIWSVGRDATVLQAALLMQEHHIGALLVLEEGRLVGMFTERDLLQRVVAERRDPAQTFVGDVMTTDVVTCHPETTIEECAAIMTNRRIRHMPVTDADGLRGVVTSGDVLAYRVAEHEAMIQELNRYVFDVR